MRKQKRGLGDGVHVICVDNYKGARKLSPETYLIQADGETSMLGLLKLKFVSKPLMNELLLGKHLL